MQAPTYSGLPGRTRSLSAVPSIYVENLDELIAKMKKVDPDLQKEFRRGLNKSVPGIIYELAGFGSSRSRGRTRRVSRNPNASEAFIGKLQGTANGGYREKRLIYRASQQLGGQVNDNLYGVLKKYLGKEFRG
jgi:hypothetical protein